jgi:hypothetical protein
VKRMLKLFHDLRMKGLMCLKCPKNQKGSMYLRVYVLLPVQNQKRSLRCIAE